jgi:hypothetical protein
MSFFTYGYIKDKVEDDLDLQEETFISPIGMLKFANEAVREGEAIICNINEDYFLTSQAIPLFAGVAEYDLPEGIYATKIRGLVFSDGNNRTYQLKKLRNFREIPYIDQNSTRDYSFLIKNSEENGVKLVLYPASRVTSTTVLTCWHIRNARTLVNESDECDLPEFVNFVIAHMKVSCARKEGHPLLGVFEAELEKQKELMVTTLSSMIVDEDNVMTMDMSLYEDMS